MNSTRAGVSLARPGTRKVRGSCPRAGVLLDRDGTIIVDHGYVGSVDRVEFIDGSPEAIARFNRAGVPYTAAIETTTDTPTALADEINLIWTRGFIDLAASR